MPTPVVILNDSVQIPSVAFGTDSKIIRKPSTPQILQALQHGFRHIDTAEMYMNEESVGAALAEYGGERKDIYVTTKWGRVPGNDIPVTHPRDSLLRSLSKMKLDYIDMYILHSPLCMGDYNLEEAWKIFESLKEGLCKSIGISNCPAKYITPLSKAWNIPPAVNQIEHHPYVAHHPTQQRAIQACREYGIAIWPFTPCHVEITDKPKGPAAGVIRRVAAEKGWSNTQVLLAWAAQTSEGPVVTSSTNESRLDEIMAVFDGSTDLSQIEVDAIADAARGLYFRKYDAQDWEE